MNREDLTQTFEKNKILGKGVEVGSYKGEYAKIILNNWTGQLYLIDVWKDLNTEEYKDCSNQSDYTEVYKNCMSNINGSEHRCFMLRCDSINAVNLFDEESLDFVYIDANHKYEFVLQDLKLWFPKLRKGGIFAGHDYLKMDWNDSNNSSKNRSIYIGNNYIGEFGVNPAVEEFCKLKGYTYNVTDEWWGSWYFTK